MTDLIERLHEAGDVTSMDAAVEITRLRKAVDALTVKLNKVLNDQYLGEALLKERIDALEHRLSAMQARVEQLRYVKEGG